MNVLEEKPSTVAIVMWDTCIEQKLIYENISRYCVNCKHLGHDIKGCRWIKHDKGNMRHRATDTTKTGLDTKVIGDMNVPNSH